MTHQLRVMAVAGTSSQVGWMLASSRLEVG